MIEVFDNNTLAWDKFTIDYYKEIEWENLSKTELKKHENFAKRALKNQGFKLLKFKNSYVILNINTNKFEIKNIMNLKEVFEFIFR
jgi:hypothetical protein